MVPEFLLHTTHTVPTRNTLSATDTHGWPNPTLVTENLYGKYHTIGPSQMEPASRQRRLVHLPCIFGTAWRRWNQQIDGLAIRFWYKLPFLYEFDSHKYKLCVIDNNTCDSSRKAALRTVRSRTMVKYRYGCVQLRPKWLRLLNIKAYSRYQTKKFRLAFCKYFLLKI